MKINFLNQDLKWKETVQNGFDTRRLRVRALDKDDLTKMSEISDNKELFAFVNGIKDGDAAVRWVQSVYGKRNYLFFSIKEKTVKPVKDSSLLGILMLNRDFDGKIEIGGWLGTEFQGRGFGDEVVKGLVDLTQKKSGGLQLYAEVQTENLAALQVLESSGIKQKINPCRKKTGKD